MLSPGLHRRQSRREHSQSDFFFFLFFWVRRDFPWSLPGCTEAFWRAPMEADLLPWQTQNHLTQTSRRRREKISAAHLMSHTIPGDAYRTEPGSVSPPHVLDMLDRLDAAQAERQTEPTAAKSDSYWPRALLGRSDQLEEEDVKLFGSSCWERKKKRKEIAHMLIYIKTVLFIYPPKFTLSHFLSGLFTVGSVLLLQKYLIAFKVFFSSSVQPFKF